MPESNEVKFRVVCMCCPTVLTEGDADAPVSHGLCEHCLVVELAKVDALPQQAKKIS